VAEVLGVSHATYRKRVSRARDRVRGALSSHCGVVNPQAACMCHRRVARAQELGRLAPEDALVSLDVPALRSRVQALDELVRDIAFYRADPDSSVVSSVVPRVMSIVLA
jgi:hypothetical protein